ncbi:insulinase family protein [Criblamydia sequanensis]|uniref:Protease 3 n=1 Tax=Candidatus Criblamydia sequanensis CRIB-18 TaxID=1437425 RepID=A0A090D2A9_9BACT|nr:insulinase family protein [Criblamydia sequanensis]CDR34183.1 Metallopeptidase, M16 family [Criblamydia sequanensis CRIB-18]
MKFLFFLLGLFVINQIDALETIKDERTIPILTPSLKDQKSVKLRLDNGLEAFIISDPDTDKTGAVLTVLTGGFSDPLEHPGMAHFLEHMLFLGTEEYPDESEYQRYIKDHGGSANAFTTSDATTFLFTVDPDGLEGALSRFSSFFKKPLFSPSGVARELNAIDQEYSKNIENEDFRDLYVHYDLASPEYRKRAFYMGNSKSLSKVTQDELKKWYETNYSAHIMKLIVVGKQPLEELKQLVIKDFSGIPKREIIKTDIAGPLSNPSFAGKLIYIEPLQELRTLNLTFEVPEKYKKMLDSKPYSVVCSVLGDESETSLLNALKKEGLAESLTCGDLHFGGKKLEIYVQIGLTAKGVANWQTVLERFLQAVANFKEKKFPKMLFDDINQIQTLSYQFQSRENLFSDLMMQGIRIIEEPLSTYPERSLVTKKYDEKAVMNLLSYLSLQNMHIYLKAPKGEVPYKADQEEPWLHVRYGITSLTPEDLNRFKNIKLNKAIDLPEKNRFLPKNVAVHPLEETETRDTLLPIPKLILDTAFQELYYAKDTSFRLPQSTLNFQIHTKASTLEDVRSQTLLELYLRSIREALNPLTYPAKVAGMDFDIKKGIYGILLTVDGFSDSIDDVLQAMIQTLKDPKAIISQFDTAKDALSREWGNFPLSPPINQGVDELKALLYKESTLPTQKLIELKQITKEDFAKWVSHFFDEAFIKGLVFGDISGEKATDIAKNLTSSLVKNPLPKDQIKRPSIVDLGAQESPFYISKPIASKGNAAILAIETPFPFSFEKRASHHLLSQSLSEPFFSELRTKQQTGYIVQAQGEEAEKALFQYFLVQSSSHSTEDLLARFELFIETFTRDIKENIPEERFNNLKSAAVYLLKNPAKSLSEMGKLLSYIYLQYDDFTWLDQRLKALESLTYEDFINYSKKVLGKKNKARAAILLNGLVEDESFLQYKRAESLEVVKKELTYVP